MLFWPRSEFQTARRRWHDVIDADVDESEYYPELEAKLATLARRVLTESASCPALWTRSTPTSIRPARVSLTLPPDGTTSPSGIAWAITSDGHPSGISRVG